MSLQLDLAISQDPDSLCSGVVEVLEDYIELIRKNESFWDCTVAENVISFELWDFQKRVSIVIKKEYSEGSE